jgi:hypothetical protein
VIIYKIHQHCEKTLKRPDNPDIKKKLHAPIEQPPADTAKGLKGDASMREEG